MSFERPYEGLRVVDLSQGVAGPYCGMLLAQQGADVIKIEPSEGDWSRILGVTHGDQTAYSIPANLGKRSLVLDLKKDEARNVVDRLVGDADVFIEGFRPGVTDRLGFSYKRLRELNERLIYVSVSGFGQTGPMRERPAMDPILQAFTGYMSENKGLDGIPHRTPVILFDMATGLYAQQAVGAALYARRDHDKGRRINFSLMETAAAFTAIRLMSVCIDGPFRPASAPSGTFRTKDGWLQMIAVKNHEFQKLCKALDLGELADDPRFADITGRRAHTDYLVETVSGIFASEPTAVWQQRLTEAGVQHEAVLSYDEFVAHPQTAAVGAISWLEQTGSAKPWPVPNVPGIAPPEPGSLNATSPAIGEHSRAILAEAGYSAGEIDRLFEDGIAAGA